MSTCVRLHRDLLFPPAAVPWPVLSVQHFWKARASSHLSQYWELVRSTLLITQDTRPEVNFRWRAILIELALEYEHGIHRSHLDLAEARLRSHDLHSKACRCHCEIVEAPTMFWS